MSTRVWGTIEFGDVKVSEEELVDIAFKIIIVGAENKIAVDLGARVKPWVYERYMKIEQSQNLLPFQLTNHSLNPNVDALFTGEGNEVYGDSWDESFDSRMTRLQRFIESTLKIKPVNKLIMHIDPEYGEEVIVNVKANRFKAKILEIYQLHDNMIPNAIFIISL